jgi:hypothetical protein
MADISTPMKPVSRLDLFWFGLEWALPLLALAAFSLTEVYTPYVTAGLLLLLASFVLRADFRGVPGAIPDRDGVHPGCAQADKRKGAVSEAREEKNREVKWLNLLRCGDLFYTNQIETIRRTKLGKSHGASVGSSGSSSSDEPGTSDEGKVRGGGT